MLELKIKKNEIYEVGNRKLLGSHLIDIVNNHYEITEKITKIIKEHYNDRTTNL